MVDKKEEGSKKKKNNPISKFRNNPWILASMVLGLLVVVFLILSLSGGCATITGEVAGEKVTEYLNSMTGGGVSLVDIEEEGSLYKATVSYEGQRIPVHITQDGEYLVQGVQEISMTGEVVDDSGSESQEQQTGSYSEEDLEKLSDFNNCLAEKGVKIYGANWCGYTSQWVETLGGFDIVSPVYIECTENEELCSQEEVRGYPTTKINGETYTGDRTLEAIGQETGCEAPILSGNTNTNPQDASC
ncbi:MAG: hypothetical protein ACOCUU_02510 [Nanoarchaeota archaeon]